MKKKVFTFGFTFFMEASQALKIQMIADSRKVSLSQVIRDAIDAYLDQITEGGLSDGK